MARYSKEYKLLENNRNSKSEIKRDINYIEETLSYLEKGNTQEVRNLLRAWRADLTSFQVRAHEAVCMCYHLFLKGKITKEEFTHIQKLSNTETKENSELIKQLLRGFKKRK